MEQCKGKVKWFNNAKGYGFIECADGIDAFVHYSAIDMDGYKTLREQEWVEYDLLETPKGRQAANVRLRTTPVPLEKFDIDVSPAFVAV